jgi:hypothetical protein
MDNVLLTQRRDPLKTIRQDTNGSCLGNNEIPQGAQRDILVALCWETNLFNSL